MSTLGKKKSHKSKMFRDGRIVLSPSDWRKLREWVWRTFNSYRVLFPICHICRARIYWYDDFNLDHLTPRGLGGGTRDDRFVKPSHSWCNRERGSKRLSNGV